MRSLFRRERVEKELDEELQYHLERKIEELTAQGLPPAEARNAAIREMGGLEQRKEECRDARRVRWIEDLFRDVALGLRLLRKNPGFTAVVIIALALGIGANTALFSLFNQVLIRSLPVANPGELVIVGTTNGLAEADMTFSYPAYREFRDKNTAFTGVLAQAGLELNVGYEGQSEKAFGQTVSGNYFTTLGVRPWIGRLLGPEDDQTSGAHPVAVLSNTYWQRRFGGDPSIVGKQLILNGHSITVLGVTPPSFYGTELAANPDISVPMAMTTVFRPIPANRLENPRHRWLKIMARLSPGVSISQAQASLEILHHQFLEQDVLRLLPTASEFSRKQMLAKRIALLRGDQGFSEMQKGLSKAFFLLFGITIVLLVITCANLANMLLARNAAREEEITMRLALGASRSRLVRQWLTESALLSLLGGAAGVLVATWCARALLSFLPENQRTNLSVSVDPLVLGFAVAASLVTGILFGIIPALQVSKASLEHAKKGSSRVTGGFRGSLVALQITLCLPLLIVAGLLLNSLRNTRLATKEFHGRNVILASLNPSLNGYPPPRVRELFDRLLEQARAIPDVQAAALATGVILSGGWDEITINVEGYQPREDEDMNAYENTVSSDYFRALGLPILAGRDFSAGDNLGASKVGIINETMARYYFGERSPIGKTFTTDPKAPPDIEIVGVVKDAKYVSAKETPKRHIYLAAAQAERLIDMTLHIRSAGKVQFTMEQLRGKLREIDPNVPLYDVKTLETGIDEILASDRLITWLSTCLGVLATLLATIGLYGVIAFSVARRTREIGIRIALGAGRRALFFLIVKQVALLVSIGLGSGLILAAASCRFLGAILFGVTPADPVTFVSAVMILLSAAALAVYFPARRALRVDPSVALRCE
jgi:predicted permease